MRHVWFWGFQAIVLCGVVAYIWMVIASPQDLAVTSQRSTSAQVLGQSHVNFYRNSQSGPDPAKIHEFVNRQRKEVGLQEVIASVELSELAYRRAVDMQNVGYYAHENPNTGETFVDELQAEGVDYQFTCENLNLSFHEKESSTVRAWLESHDGHRECMLHEGISEAGYAVIEASLPIDTASYIVVAIYTSP